MTYKIYKNEYSKTFIHYLKGRYKVESESEKCLTIYCTEKDAENIASQMYVSADNIDKRMFADYRTINEEEQALYEEFVKAKDIMVNALIKYANSPSYKGQDCIPNPKREARFDRLYALVVKDFAEVAKMEV